MSPNQFGKRDAAFFADLFRDYKNRMEEVAPFEAGIEKEGIYVPGREEIEQKYKDYRQSGSSFIGQAARDLVEAYIPYRDRVAQELKQRGFPDIQSGLEDFEQKTGVVDYSDGRVSTYDYDQPLHELLSHQRPYDLGMAPDYRDFYAGTDPEGNPVIVRSNAITPINEDLATGLDVNRNRGLRGKDPVPPEVDVLSTGGFTDLLQGGLNRNETLDDASRRLLPARIELHFPTRTPATGYEVFPSTEGVDADVKRATELLTDKYVKPANQRLAGLLATQFPGIDTKTRGLNDVEQFLTLVENLEGKPTNRSKYFYSTLVPGVTPGNLANLAKDIRRTPSSLAPGVADLIPSAEAVRAGYEQGPEAMGKQMAQDFVAGLPVSAALTPVLANPAVAPFAPGVGLGLIGSAAVEAADEAVRQETGEGITPKLRQFLGTKERTGLADKPYEIPTEPEPTPTLGVAEPRSGLQKFRDEIQFRKDLAGERFNPRRGEFGLSELIFGR